MITFKQSAPALIGIFLALGLADGEPTNKQLVFALITAFLTLTYVIACVAYNQYKSNHHEHK